MKTKMTDTDPKVFESRLKEIIFGLHEEIENAASKDKDGGAMNSEAIQAALTPHNPYDVIKLPKKIKRRRNSPASFNATGSSGDANVLWKLCKPIDCLKEEVYEEFLTRKKNMNVRKRAEITKD